MSKTSLIITSIAAPNAAMKIYSEKCKLNGIDFLVVGDVPSPKDFQLDGCRFISIEEQRNLSLKFAQLLPERHYSRKNIGYLLAKNSDIIIETDDDNFPKENFWDKSFVHSGARLVSRKGWVNTYKYFTSENIWPRGFPLEEIQGVPPEVEKINRKITTPIIQGLADENPDVDAVYRMTQKLPLQFEQNDAVVLGDGCWCPFNSQNTAWKKEAFPLLYLPSYCSFRMTDIWRSLIAQRIAWTCGWNIVFHSADAWQERNEHNLLKDFNDEVSGYLNNERIRRVLEDLDLKSGVENIGENLMRCYNLMTNNTWIVDKEMKLLEFWIHSFF
jgi:hypothetical protein